MGQPVKVYLNYYKNDGFFYTIELVDHQGRVIRTKDVVAFDREQAAQFAGQVLAQYLTEEKPQHEDKRATR